MARDISVNQIEVKTDFLWARKRPEVNDAVIIGYIKKGIYNVRISRDMRHESSNGYLWYEVEPFVWITYSDSWSAYFEAQAPDQAIPDDRTELIIELQAKNTALKKQNASQAAALNAYRLL